ncbi:MAG: hypothetical protein GY943_24920 [Chloroflexi bacterium]|nr:hypothetical protein [Chloroflexota bacterium]
MFKSIKWNQFPRDFIIIQIGFAIFGLSIATLIRANLGTSPWVMLTVALSEIFGLSPGTLTMIIGVVILSVILILREPIGWGTLGNIMFIGPWIDVALRFIPAEIDNLLLQGTMLVLSALLMGLASAIYIGVDTGAGPRDSLMLAVTRTRGWSLRRARGTIEVMVLIFGWLLGGPIGIGTIIFALIIGPSIQWNFKLLNVQPYRIERLPEAP